MSVGNDIVDLDSPHVTGKSRDEKFLNRVLTPEEQAAILQSDEPDVLLQVYWAARETAYKAIARSNPTVSSAPRRYRVFLDEPRERSTFTGYVQTPAETVLIRGCCNQEYVHCLGAVTVSDLEKIQSGVEKVVLRTGPDYGRSSVAVSRAARTLVKKTIASLQSVQPGHIMIKKSPLLSGVSFPEIFINKKKTDIPISLSHDGRFVAFALMS
ncbi:MAG: 4'-phosphopantetheinyl transferase superfamily protein [Thermodesulfobacteriota bacterium]